MRELRQQLLDAPNELAYSTSARIIAEIGGESNRAFLLDIALNHAIGDGRRAAATSALGTLGDATVAPALLAAHLSLV